MPAVTGRTPEGRTVASVVTSLASAAITAPASSFHDEDAGRTISGTGIPAGTTILSVQSDTAATMSASASAGGTITATLGAGDPQTYGFRGWSPESDAESESYAVPSTAGADKLPNTTTAREQRHRA